MRRFKKKKFCIGSETNKLCVCYNCAVLYSCSLPNNVNDNFARIL